MKTVTISVSSADETKQRFLAAFKGKLILSPKNVLHSCGQIQ